MTTYNTQNPIGSADPRDLYDNAENADRLINGSENSYPDRLGNNRLSWAGMESRFADFLANSGYQFVGDYAAGIEITEYNQIVLDVSGEFWRLSGTAGLPYTTTGAGLPEGGAFVAVGDAALRQELADGTAVVSSSTGPQTVAEALDRRAVHFVNVQDMLAATGFTENQEIIVRGTTFVYQGGNFLLTNNPRPESWWVAGFSDDTEALQSAIDYVAGEGGGAIDASHSRLDISSVTVKPNVYLYAGENIGEQQALGFDYAAVAGTLFVSGTITLNDGAAIKGAQIINSYLKDKFPIDTIATVNDAVANFTGTAILQAGQDTKVEGCLVLGFETGYYSTTVVGSGVPRERSKVIYSMFDCTNCVHIDRASDVPRLLGVHCRQIVSSRVPGTDSRRQGAAFKCTTTADTLEMTDCFEYGWDIGFDITSKYGTILKGCHADGSSNNDWAQVGFKLSGDSTSVLIVGCMASGKYNGALINGDPASSDYLFSSCDFHGNVNHIRGLNYRSLGIITSLLKDTRSSGRCVSLESTVEGITTIVGNTFPHAGVVYAIPDNVLRNATINENTYGDATDPIGTRESIGGTSGVGGNVNHKTSVSNGSGIGRVITHSYSRGSRSAPAIVQTGDVLLENRVGAYDGAADHIAARVIYRAQGTQGASATPTRIEFHAAKGTGSATGAWLISQDHHLIPFGDNVSDVGSAGNRAREIYAANSTINTSDEREKEQQRESSESEKRVAVALKSGGQFFKWISAVEKKGDDARWHYGWMAQDVVKAFDAEGLDAHDYGMLCYDEWEEIPDIKDESEDIIQEYRPAGNRYGVRMDQILAFIVCNA